MGLVRSDERSGPTLAVWTARGHSLANFPSLGLLPASSQ
jgi:hypothetical protein